MLFILRHAEASHDAPNDVSRVLTERGRKDATRVGLWLKQRMVLPQQIITSSAARTRETSEIVAKTLGFDTTNISALDELYLASESQLLKSIQSVSDDVQHLIVVGHNPGLQDLVRLISKSDATRVNQVDFLPATIAMLGNIPSWQTLAPETASLFGIIHGHYLTKSL